MDVREKLVELLNEVQETGVNEIPAGFGYTSEYVNNETVASHLIAHGVTVQELALPEEDYYVLRNPETGMYFRGRGVNRWGKHFNQATIYRVRGTAEHSIKEIAWHGEKAELVCIKIVEMPHQPKGE